MEYDSHSDRPDAIHSKKLRRKSETQFLADGTNAETFGKIAEVLKRFSPRPRNS
jgi:hypothetical protein